MDMNKKREPDAAVKVPDDTHMEQYGNSLIWYRIKDRVAWQKQEIKRRGFRPEGIRFIGLDGEQEFFPRGNRFTNLVLSNLEKVDKAGAFEVFRNMNNEVAIKQLIWLPHFYLV